MAFSPDGNYAVSSGRSEGQVMVWAVGKAAVSAAKARMKREGKAGKDARLDPAGLLSLEEPAVQLATASTSGRGSEDSDEGFLITAVSEAGRAYVWQWQPGQAGELSTGRLLARVQIGKGPTKG